MKVRRFTGEEVLWTSSDDDGPCTITWSNDNSPPKEDAHECDGWVSGGVLFAPQYDDEAPGTAVVDGLPVAGWYEVSTGLPAVVMGDMVLIPPFFPDPVDGAYDYEAGTFA
jgi:hypothetical protein